MSDIVNLIYSYNPSKSLFETSIPWSITSLLCVGKSKRKFLQFVRFSGYKNYKFSYISRSTLGMLSNQLLMAWMWANLMLLLGMLVRQIVSVLYPLNVWVVLTPTLSSFCFPCGLNLLSSSVSRGQHQILVFVGECFGYSVMLIFLNFRIHERTKPKILAVLNLQALVRGLKVWAHFLICFFFPTSRAAIRFI